MLAATFETATVSRVSTPAVDNIETTVVHIDLQRLRRPQQRRRCGSAWRDAPILERSNWLMERSNKL